MQNIKPQVQEPLTQDPVQLHWLDTKEADLTASHWGHVWNTQI